MEIQKTKSLSIKEWAEEDRPREKLLLKGRQALTDAELLAILIGSGSAEKSAVALSRDILNQAGNKLSQLAQFSVKDLEKFKGIGEAKAITIVSALELGRRRKEEHIEEKQKIKSSSDLYAILKPYLLDLNHEQFWVVLCNRSMEVIKIQQVSAGGVSGTVADPKMIYKLAVEHLASSVFVAHNHPSGNLQPSLEDKKLTEKLFFAGQALDILLQDHLIFTNRGYLSFKDEGLL